MSERRLIVMRHAKSSWTSGEISDHKRPLNRRGVRTAPKVGERLLELGWVPEHVVSSDSRRTRDTWNGASKALPGEISVEFTERLYLAGLEDTLSLIASQPERLETLLILGHNPCSEELGSWLSGEAVVLKTADVLLLTGFFDSWGESVEQAGLWTLEQQIVARAL